MVGRHLGAAGRKELRRGAGAGIVARWSLMCVSRPNRRSDQRADKDGQYEAAATELKNLSIKLAKVDCTAETELCSDYEVQGYPYVVLSTAYVRNAD